MIAPVLASGFPAATFVVIVLIAAVLFLIGKSILIIVPEYERAVFFRFGRILQGAKGPGIIVRIPAVDRVVKVNQRVEVVDIPPQAVISKDNVTIQVDAVVYFQVVDPVRAIIGVDNFRFASQRVAMTSLRSIIGRFELDGLLAHREDVNGELRTVIGQSTEIWGVQVRQVEVRDIQLPPELLRAMARQAEAERERRAKVIAATGELEASKELAEAADKLTSSPGALQLRTLQTLAEVATERNSTLIFPIPIELFSMFNKDGGPTVGALPTPADPPPSGRSRRSNSGGGKTGPRQTPELGPPSTDTFDQGQPPSNS
jgi:regulator of protease activity HflC (stomatin/prohibitin superfamily)